MKLTKTKLRQIINEEVKALTEALEGREVAYAYLGHSDPSARKDNFKADHEARLAGDKYYTHRGWDFTEEEMQLIDDIRNDIRAFKAGPLEELRGVLMNFVAANEDVLLDMAYVRNQQSPDYKMGPKDQAAARYFAGSLLPRVLD